MCVKLTWMALRCPIRRREKKPMVEASIKRLHSSSFASFAQSNVLDSLSSLSPSHEHLWTVLLVFPAVSQPCLVYKREDSFFGQKRRRKVTQEWDFLCFLAFGHSMSPDFSSRLLLLLILLLILHTDKKRAAFHSCGITSFTSFQFPCWSFPFFIFYSSSWFQTVSLHCFASGWERLLGENPHPHPTENHGNHELLSFSYLSFPPVYIEFTNWLTRLLLRKERRRSDFVCTCKGINAFFFFPVHHFSCLILEGNKDLKEENMGLTQPSDPHLSQTPNFSDRTWM